MKNILILISLLFTTILYGQNLSGPASPTINSVPTFLNSKKLNSTAVTIDSSGNLSTTGSILSGSGASGAVTFTSTAPILFSKDAVTLTESTSTIVLNITISSGNYVSVQIIAGTFAADSSERQDITDVFLISAVNKAGAITISSTASSPTTSGAAKSDGGTLTTAWTVVQNGNSIDIKNSAVSGLTQTTLQSVIIASIIRNGTVTIQ